MGKRIVAFVVAFAFGSIASAALVAQRLHEGASPHAWAFGAAVMFAAIVMLVSAQLPPPRPRELIGAHVLGAILPVMAVHGCLALAVRGGAVELVEGPPQLVNDAVLVLGIVGLVHAAAEPAIAARLGWLVATAALVVGYAATAACWHRDPFAGLAIQHYVTVQVVAAAVCLTLLLVLRAASRRA